MENALVIPVWKDRETTVELTRRGSASISAHAPPDPSQSPREVGRSWVPVENVYKVLSEFRIGPHL